MELTERLQRIAEGFDQSPASIVWACVDAKARLEALEVALRERDALLKRWLSGEHFFDDGKIADDTHALLSPRSGS